MEWFENKTTQLIALVTIVGTLAGFGYTGATYINRLENLEAQIGSLGETEDAQQAIEERFSSIQTSVDYINKSIDEGINVSLRTQSSSINSLKAQVEGISVAIDVIEEDIDKLEQDNKNPLTGG
jgi:peptidoglycan hydrolase CwlO-like protein|tara:strand:- start:569 stop:940 length:372 start_codon:yes stop_codon:yes gene_type:complete